MSKKNKLDKVLAEWRVDFSDNNYEFMVKKGELVDRNTVLLRARKEKIKECLAVDWVGDWSVEEVKSALNSYLSKTVEAGDLLMKKGWLKKKYLQFPLSGKLLEVDEMANLKFKVKNKDRIEILSPVKAKVIKAEKGKIKLEFEAIELEVEVLVGGKGWGNLSLNVLKKTRDLVGMVEGEVILVDDLDQALVTKAEVLGAKAIVWLNGKEKDRQIESEIPIFVVNKHILSDLYKFLDKNKRHRVLFNSDKKRLLFVVE
ncbi:hypothetical protein DRH14_01045 [Candidatus Shapirobacteria bacterium]|nr:MAG: hypothetical protein DRH14_01045 [Candidatus Shapirobacteria bacterium]